MNFQIYYSSSEGNLYTLDNIIIDPGVNINKIRRKINLINLETGGLNYPYALVSHSHADHCQGVKELLKLGVQCCMTKETAQALGVQGHFRLKIINIGRALEVGHYNVLPFATRHDCPGSVGFCLDRGQERFIFCTDTVNIPYQFKGMTGLAIEANYSEETLAPNLGLSHLERIRLTHHSLESVIDFLKRHDLFKLEKLYLIHLSEANSDKEYFRREIEKVYKGELVI